MNQHSSFRFSRLSSVPALAALLLLLAPGVELAATPKRPSAVPADARYHKKARAWYRTSGGVRKVWYGNGAPKAVGPMKSKKREGQWVFYHRSGKKKGEGSFRKGRLEGAWKLYYANGGIYATGNYRDNYRTGKWTYYDRAGRKQSVGTYQNGYRSGAWIEYYSGGEVFYRGEYKKNREHGNFKYYTIKGKVVQAGRFQGGVRVGTWYVCVAGQCGRKTFKRSSIPRRSGQVNPMGRKRGVTRNELTRILDGKRRGRSSRGAGWR